MYIVVTENEKELLEFLAQKGITIYTVNDLSNIPAEKPSICLSTEAELLSKLGIKIHLNGYGYLKFLFESKLDCSKGITKFIYPKIAEKFGTTPLRVERAIRHAIEGVDHTKESYNLYLTLFGSFDTNPTNAQFIKGVYNYLSQF